MSSARGSESVVQAQLDAYNSRDLEAFLAAFAEDAQLFEFGDPVPTTRGKAAIGERYRQLFSNSPMLHSELLNRCALGRAVVDLERVTGRNGSAEPFDIMAIYEVADGSIVRAHFVRP